MKNFLALFLSLGILAGCNTTGQVSSVLVTQKLDPITIPEQLLDCEELKRSELPNPATLRDARAARLFLKMNQRIRECASDVDSIEELIAERNKIMREAGLLKDLPVPETRPTDQ